MRQLTLQTLHTYSEYKQYENEEPLGGTSISAQLQILEASLPLFIFLSASANVFLVTFSPPSYHAHRHRNAHTDTSSFLCLMS